MLRLVWQKQDKSELKQTSGLESCQFQKLVFCHTCVLKWWSQQNGLRADLSVISLTGSAKNTLCCLETLVKWMSHNVGLLEVVSFLYGCLLSGRGPIRVKDFAASGANMWALCVLVCWGHEGAQVSLTQLPNHDAKGLHPCLSMLGGSSTLTVLHTCIQTHMHAWTRLSFFFTTGRPTPNSIHHHPTGFDRWNDVDLIERVFRSADTLAIH